ncbi:hypothetical protein Gpo141_00013374 [Globisporangium polare]
MDVRLATFLTGLALASAATDALSTVHPGVHRALRTAGTVDLVIELTQTTESTLESLKEDAYASRTAKIEALKNRLQALSKAASGEVVKVLSKEATGLHEGFRNFWITNQITVDSASFEMVEKLAALDSVANIREQEYITIEKLSSSTSSSKEAVRQAWGVAKIGAPGVWTDGNNTGQGVIVGGIDTGVLGTHEALIGNFLGAKGWYDPETEGTDPYDIDGHGSHTMGTVAGSHGIGVAPGVQWIACKACRYYPIAEGEGQEVKCAEADLLSCAQFMVCPTDPDGKNPDCSKAPRVINNSWGGAGGRPYFKPAVDAWIKAGIVPVFSQGNTGGNGCATAGSPGDYPNVIGVGATDSTDALSYFSSKGPTIDTQALKPDISAPGDSIRSADFLAEDGYWTTSGTSTAAPHVTGAIALLLSAQPELSFDEVKMALYTTSVQAGLGASSYTCGNTSDLVWPNNQYGYGRLNALSATKASA